MRSRREHAVVIGASMGGLLAARVLAEHHRLVTVIERDRLQAVGEQRPGVPQARHAHGLLARGREALEELFPGLTDELIAQGAEPGDVQSFVRWWTAGHRLRPAVSGLDGLLVSRPLLEGQVRRRVLELGNVEIVDGTTVRGLVTDADGTTVVGIRVADDVGEQATIAANLVVDASGRASRSPTWLAELGFPVPRVDEVRVDVGYATRTFRRCPEHLGGDRGVVDAPAPPNGRVGVALAVEGERWVVTLGGYGPDQPPSDPDGWQSFATRLSGPDVAALVAEAEPLDDPVAFRFPASTRRRYERLKRFPTGFLVFGDALCSFNPIYGQGMTVAALEALALRDCIHADARSLARVFFRRAARVIDVPWDTAVGADLQFDHVRGTRPVKVRLVNRYLARLHIAAENDPVLSLAFLRVLNLLDRPERLLAPANAVRVLRGNRPRRRPALASSGPMSEPVELANRSWGQAGVATSGRGLSPQAPRRQGRPDAAGPGVTSV
jgi:2-polyprenyl-6-methoxyphenol hydroxylase-like FAD-dependent oxidoreductase